MGKNKSPERVLAEKIQSLTGQSLISIHLAASKWMMLKSEMTRAQALQQILSDLGDK